MLQELPFQMVSAEIDRIRIEIPITDLYNGPCKLFIDGLLVKVTPLSDVHSEEYSLRGRSWLYDLASSLSLEKKDMTGDVELYRSLMKITSNKHFHHHHGLETKQDVLYMDSPHGVHTKVTHKDEMEDSDRFDSDDEDDSTPNDDVVDDDDAVGAPSSFSGMSLISDLVERILHNLQIEINNTSIVITHPSPMDSNFDTVLVLKLRELTVSNLPTNERIDSSDDEFDEEDHHDDSDDDDDDDVEGHRSPRIKKRIKFGGLLCQLFHTALTESIIGISDSQNENNVIIHGEPESEDPIERQSSYFDIEVPMAAVEQQDRFKQRKIDIVGFIRNLRGVLNPLQLSLFLDICQTIALSAELVSKRGGSNGDDDDGGDDEQDGNKPILNFELKVASVILCLLESNDDRVPSDWYLTNDPDHEQFSQKGLGLSLELCPAFPWIPELLCGHIGMKLSNIGIHFQNIPSISLCTVTVAEWSMAEFICPQYFERGLESRPKPRQMISRRILVITQHDEDNLENWKPQVTISMRNVYKGRHDINVNIQPATIDLDFELFSRLHLISRAFAFIADRKYTLEDDKQINGDDGISQKEPAKECDVIQTIAVQTSSIFVRFHVNNDDHLARREHIVFEFDGLNASNEKMAKRIKGQSDVWNLDIEKVNVYLVYDDERHLLLSTRDTHHHETNTLRIHINDVDSPQPKGSDDVLSMDNETESSEFTTDLEKPHFRWWEEGAARASKEIKFPKGDRMATTLQFNRRAASCSPTHIEIVLPKAVAAVSKSVCMSPFAIIG